MSLPASADQDGPLRGATPLQAVERFLRRSLVFTGRASRSEFWWACLAVAAAAVLLALAGTALGALTTALGARADAGPGPALVPLSLLLLAVGTLVPTAALVVRRLHDADLSGLLALLWLIPTLGGLVILALCLLPEQPAGRRFDRAAPGGSDPVPRRGPTALRRGTATAADLAHAVASLPRTAGDQRPDVARLAARHGAPRTARGADDRFAASDGDVVVRYGPDGRVTAVAAERR